MYQELYMKTLHNELNKKILENIPVSIITAQKVQTEYGIGLYSSN